MCLLNCHSFRVHSAASNRHGCILVLSPVYLHLQAVSNTLWAYAKMGKNPGLILLDMAAMKALSMCHQYTIKEIANTLWAFAELSHCPPEEALNALAVQFAKRMGVEHPLPEVQAFLCRRAPDQLLSLESAFRVRVATAVRQQTDCASSCALITRLCLSARRKHLPSPYREILSHLRLDFANVQTPQAVSVDAIRSTPTDCSVVAVNPY